MTKDNSARKKAPPPDLHLQPSIAEELQTVTQTYLTLTRAEKRKERKRREAFLAKVNGKKSKKR